MTRILHVSAVEFTLAKLLLPQLRHQRDLGFDVRAACKLDSDSRESELKEFSATDIRFPRQPRPLKMLRAAVKIRSLIRELRPDIVHLHTPAAAMAVRLLPRRFYGDARLVYTVHGFAHSWPPQGLKNRLLQIAERHQAARTDAMLFVSHEDMQEARGRGYRSDLHYAGNGVSPEWFSLPFLGRDEGRLRLIYVGRLVREKGLVELIHAISQIPEVELTIVGDALPSDRDSVALELKQVVERLGLVDRVSFLGMLGSSEVRESLARAHALVLPSYREGLPLSVIEALAAGRPCVVTRIRGCRELVKDGITGFLCDPEDVQTLAEALRKMARLSPNEYEGMSEAARQLARSRYEIGQVNARIDHVYGQLLRRTRHL